MTDSAFVVIGTFTDELQAHTARTKLESEGIDSYIADAATVRMDPLLMQAIGGVKLRVNARDAYRARQLLSDDLSDLVEDHPDNPLLKCPQCESVDVRFERFLHPVGFMAFFLFWAPIPWLKRNKKCNGCGCRF